ncbi:putative secreted protein (Por secretion system target) [Neolewinella xylanilytica]|uniref:Putative secreted protein (Por secretion system target) n=1 Tax=Neolewinella xylanilytica TaxID=1514080 RepID=A0A2S6I8R6_9BACT|nr:sugar-binding protein [Neolewinella xylanilytica]PPK87897.1 putative secreted protein (Por secretion system target) [Neolewinella xylanilytica]
MQHNFLLFFCLFLGGLLSAQIPYVYDQENSGVECDAPPLPDPENLTNYPLLPDPFAFSDGSGRVEDFADWECRRNEIGAEIAAYEIGPKPAAPADITATYTNDTLRVAITENGETLTLTSRVTMPEGDGPFPVVIGMNNATGSLPGELFDGVIQIPFRHNQVVTYSQTSDRVPGDPYYRLYPELTEVGNYSAWAWGVSRLLDGIEIVQEALNADLDHVAVTGCSYAGKMALFSGAYDERIALTIVQESGGGGINAWRVSETIGNVEKIDNTNYSWFMRSMQTNFAGQPGLLPHDHHELMAMVLPRALLVLGNPDYEWLGDESGYVASRAVEEVYRTFGIEDRFGFSFRADHPHCQLPAESYPEVQAFVDKFLFEDGDADTNVRYHEFYGTNYRRWIADWAAPADPNAPVVALTGPEDGGVYETPATLTFTASVQDADNNMAAVLFMNNNDTLSVDSLAPYEFVWETGTVGTYRVYATAVDSAGLIGYSNEVSVTLRAPVAAVYRTAEVPTVDGVTDEIWSNDSILAFEATNELVGTDIAADDLSGTIRMIWDADNLYFLAEIIDDTLVNDSPNTYEDDNVELYFDVDNSKGANYDDNDVQLSFAWNDGTTIGTIPGDFDTEGIVYAVSDTDFGYLVEGMIPWTVLGGTPSDSMMVGFDFMINDDDLGGGRDGKLSWNATADQAWTNPGLFGTVMLVGTSMLSDVMTLDGRTITAFPNPTSDRLNIRGIDTTFDYEVFDAGGRLQARGTASQAIATDRLATGVYFLRIRVDGEALQTRFVKR